MNALRRLALLPSLGRYWVGTHVADWRGNRHEGIESADGEVCSRCHETYPCTAARDAMHDMEDALAGIQALARRSMTRNSKRD